LEESSEKEDGRKEKQMDEEQEKKPTE